MLSSSDTGQLGLGLGSGPVSGVAGLRQSAAVSFLPCDHSACLRARAMCI